MIKSIIATAAAVFLAGSVQATTYLTEIYVDGLDAPLVGDIELLRVDVTWSTNVSSGTVEVGDLDSLRFDLIDTTGVFYTDIAIVAGVAQPISGINRQTSDLIFDFDFGVGFGTLLEFDNDLFVNQNPGATGLSYHVYRSYDEIRGAKFLDGATERSLSYDILSQATGVAQVPLPPAALALLGGLTALGGLGRRRGA